MDEQQRNTVRAAAYLAAQQRSDRRGVLSTRTGKTRHGVDCNPPNKKCGNRCIPPSWDCRLEGKGTNSELAAHKTDPLAGIASLQRGSKDIVQGIVRVNPAQVQRGRNSLIRGAVKLTPGDNLEQKKQLKRKLNEASTPVMAVIGIGLVGMSAHFGLKRGFPSYRNGLGADIDRAATRAVDGVLDRIPGVAGMRAARRTAGAAAATEIAQSVVRSGRMETVRSATAGNTGRISPLSFRPGTADYEASNLRSSLDALQARARAGSLSYEQWKQSAVETLYGAQSPGTRARGQRGSVFSEHAANEFLVSKFGLNPTGVVGQQGGYSMAARNALLDTQLTRKLSDWGEAMRQDMRLRRIVAPDGAIREAEIDRYIRQVGSSTLGQGFQGLSQAQRNQATAEAHRLMRSAIQGVNLNKEAKAMRTGLVSEFDNYFDDVSRRMQRNAAASDSPFGDGMTGLARYVSRVTNQPVQIRSRDHADLVLRNHFHTRVMKLNTSFSIGDNTARRIAQQLTRSTDLPDLDSSYRILTENGFTRLERGGPASGITPRSSSARAKQANRTPEGSQRGRKSTRQSSSPLIERLENETQEQYMQRVSSLSEEQVRRNFRRGDCDDTGLPPRVQAYLTARTDLKEDSSLGKPCGASHIPKAHKCRKGQGAAGQEASSSQADNSGHPVRKALVVALGAAGATAAVAVAVDAARYFSNKQLEATGNYRQVLKQQLKKDGLSVKDSQQALANYYDTAAKDWKLGEVVYYKNERELDGHFGVYLGKRDGRHQFAGVGAHARSSDTLSNASVGLTEYGPNPTYDSKPVIWAKAPSKVQPPRAYSDTEIVRRATLMLGKPYKLDMLENNCESWASMIVSGVPHSTQVARFSAVTRALLKVRDSAAKKSSDAGFDAQQMGAWLAINHRRYVKDAQSLDFPDLKPPEDVLKAGMNELEAMSTIKNYLMTMLIPLPGHGSR